MKQHKTRWRTNSAVFHERAAEYDKWFEKSLLFEIELKAVIELETPLLEPKFEIGIGPGRFAEVLHVSLGIDPAFAPLQFSSQRNISVMQAIGEELPVADKQLATVYLLFTLCFLADPQKVFAECFRILQPGGHLVVGMVPITGAWGKALQAKKEKEHPFYKHASFYPVDSVISWLKEAGFSLVECRSSLFQKPDSLHELETSSGGLDAEAGFCLLVGLK
ncbi:MAG: methyltransferase domain-containing protein [Desulfobulbaceae bacterium]|nr:methyltransferase domain-containing protein [Desulfobulbaceae bacterium]